MICDLRQADFLPHLSSDVTLAYGAGDGLVLTGPNGLGKSTLMRLFRDRAGVTVSYVPQSPLEVFYDRRMGTFRELLLQARPQKNAEELWIRLGLQGKEHRELRALSGGELQALKLWTGLTKEAQLYLLDEPFQSLDEAKKRDLVELLTKLRAAGATVVLVEHDLFPLQSGWRILPLVVEAGSLRKGNEWTT